MTIKTSSGIGAARTRPGEFVAFDAAGQAFALPASAVREIHERPALESVRGTRVWFLGTAEVRGRLLPVTDFCAWLGGAPASGRLIELAPSIGLAALAVDEVRALVDEDPVAGGAAGRGPDAQSVAGAVSLEGIATKSVSIGGCLHRLLDAQALLGARAFLDIAAVPS